MFRRHWVAAVYTTLLHYIDMFLTCSLKSRQADVVTIVNDTGGKLTPMSMTPQSLKLDSSVNVKLGQVNRWSQRHSWLIYRRCQRHLSLNYFPASATPAITWTCIHKANFLRKLFLKMIRFQGYSQTSFLVSLAVYLAFIRIDLSTITRETVTLFGWEGGCWECTVNYETRNQNFFMLFCVCLIHLQYLTFYVLKKWEVYDGLCRWIKWKPKTKKQLTWNIIQNLSKYKFDNVLAILKKKVNLYVKNQKCEDVKKV